MPDQIVTNLSNIKSLKRKLESLEKTGMYDAISHKMLDDIKSLDWAMNELIRVHFMPTILCASKSPSAMQDLAEFDGMIIDGAAVFICVNPTKVEATVLHKYFIQDNVCGTRMRIEDHPPYLLCDGYELRDGLIYIEGFILNTHVEEIGKRGIKEQLSVWIRKLLETKGKGEKA